MMETSETLTPESASSPEASSSPGAPTSPGSGAGTGDAAYAQAACVEVTILWGATVLHVAHLAPPRSFYVGEGGASGACDCFIPAEVLGARRAPVVVVDPDGSVSVALLSGATGTIEIPGAPALSVEQAVREGAGRSLEAIEGARLITIPRSSKARIEIGGVVFQVGVTRAGRSVAGRFYVEKRALPFHGASALVHVAALATLAMLRPPFDPAADDGPSAAQIFALQSYLLAADEKEISEREASQVAESLEDVKEGGTGTRAKGEEGSTGAPNFKAAGNRYGAAGPGERSDPHIERQQALQDAAEFGMIGLLNGGAGGDPNAPTAPWGRDDSMGQPPLHPGSSSSGDAFGGSGLGSIASGGGGRGQGIGLGSIGSIGRGAGSGWGQGLGTGASRAAASSAPIARSSATDGEETSAAKREAPIDPNGRFATTYRPGGGHLAAFESAVARGILPAAERDIVSDIGARYAPELTPLPGKALSLRADLERGALPPSGGAFHVRIAMGGAPQASEARPHLSVHLVLDVSGSMSGEPIARAREAAEKLVDRLAPTDDFSLVTFSTGAQVLVPDGLVGARREAIKAVIRGIREEGGTNIGEGLSLAYVQASLPSIPEDAVRVVLLLSDGRATAGVTNSEQLSRLALDAFQKGIQTSSLGLGSDYDGPLMSSIASDGAGGYYYLRDGDQIAAALSTELEKRLDPVATAVEVRVRLKKDVDLLRVYGSRRLSQASAARVRAAEVAADRHAEARDHIKQDRQDDSEGGMRFFIPAFAKGDSHALLLKVSVPAGTGSRAIASVELKYKDRLSRTNVVEEIPVSVSYSGSDAASAASADPSVARTVQGFAAGEALTEASALIANGDRDRAIALLAEREDILTQAASTLGEPLFLRDASRLARLRSHAGSSGGAFDPLVLSMLLETAGRTHLR